MNGATRPLKPSHLQRHPLAYSISSLLLAGVMQLHGGTAHAATGLAALAAISGQTIDTNAASTAAVNVPASHSLIITQSSVTSRGDDSAALSVRGALTGSDLLLQTFGHNAQAVETAGGGSATLRNVQITTWGSSVGLQATGKGSLITLDGGSITTHDADAYAIHAETGGRVEVQHVAISTNGQYGNGASVLFGGSVSLFDSTIRTAGVEAHGILLIGLDPSNRAMAAITDSVIETQGDFGIGVNINSDASATLTNSRISTSGENADGVWLAAPGTDATLTDVTITTSGDDAKGVSSQGGTATLRNINITTHGQQAHGLYSEGDTAKLTADGIAITLEKMGVAAFAIDKSQISLNSGTITTHQGGIGLLAASGATLSGRALRVDAQGDNGLALMVASAGTLLLDAVHASADGAGASALQANASNTAQRNRATLSNARLNSALGSAISVLGGEFEVNLDNSEVRGKQLLAIDENTVANKPVAHGDITVNASHSTLSGDVQVSGASVGTARINLDASTLIGAINGLDHLDVLNSSRWTLTADSTLGNLNNQSTVAFQPGSGFKTLTLTGDLSGSGTFLMNTDLANQQGDLLRIEGTHSGSHSLAIADTGHEPAAANGELLLVDGNGGDGRFALAGRPYVDAGAYRYTLAQSGDDWLLRNTALLPGKPEDSLSDGANAALGNQTAAATLWSAEMNALVKRLGELRMGHDQGGLWTRGIGKTYKIDATNSRDFEQSVRGLEIGADTAVVQDGSSLYLGGMLGTAHSRQQFGSSSRGHIDSQLLGLYATWLNDEGYYLDSVAKYNRLHNELKTQDNTGQQVKGSYRTHGYAADIEVGRQLRLQDGWFIEPQAELTHTHTASARYRMSNGLQVKVGDTDTLQGRLGSLLGRTFTLSNGLAAQPYVKASYVHAFSDHSQVTVNGHQLDNRVAGSRAEFGLGGILQVSEKTKVAVDLQHAKGQQVEEPWAVNLGLRHLW